MGEITGISWCDHTINRWIGCTKVSDGCRNCYAERDNKRYQWVTEWGKGKPRRLTSENGWKRVFLWDKMAKAAGKRAKVFCGSLMDILDDEVCNDWRTPVWDAAEKTPNLIWLFLTKRPQNLASMIRPGWKSKPPENVWFGVTVENSLTIDRIEILSDVWIGKIFVSAEPLIGYIDLGAPMIDHLVDWLIVGAESGPNHRETKTSWVQTLLDDCQYFDVPFFLKQMWINGNLVKEPEWNGRKYLEFPEEMK